MISRSWGRLMARAASSARSTSAWLTSRCLPETAMTPRLFTPRMWPPATPASTLAISTPAISSASPTACLMLSTVESMLTTTPLRNPREGLVPTPTMSSVPMEDHSAMMQQILVVPTSRPVMSCRPLPLPMSPLPLRGFEHDLVAEAQVDRRHGLSGSAELGKHAAQAAQTALPVLGADAHLDPVQHVEHRALGAAHVHLGDLAEERALGAHECAQKCHAGGQALGGHAARRRHVLPAQTGDHGRLHAHRATLRTQGHALLVDPVEMPRAHQGEGLALLHEEGDAIGKRAHELRAPDEWKRLDPGHRAPHVQSPQALAGHEAGGLDHLIRGEPTLPRHLDAIDGEARAGEERSSHGGERAAQRDEGHGQAEPDHHAAEPAQKATPPPAPVEALAGHGAARIGEIGQPAVRDAAGREDAGVPPHASPITRISGSREMPKCDWTRSRVMSMRAVMSAASAPPRFTMKLACLAEISAPFSRLPLSPTFSMSRPAVSPEGFFHTQPADARASGWVDFLCLRRCFISFWISACGRRWRCRRAPTSTAPAGTAKAR